MTFSAIRAATGMVQRRGADPLVSSWITGARNSASTRLTAFPDTTAHNKSAWVEMDPALAEKCTAIYGSVATRLTGNDRLLIDIGIGGAGSETVLVANILTAQDLYGGLGHFYLPIEIASGVRVSARFQAHANGESAGIGLNFLRQIAGEDGWTICETWGANTGTTQGVVLSAGGSANNKGAWFELVASSTNNIKSVLIGTSATKGAIVDGNHFLDIATGAALSEVVVLGDVMFRYESDTDLKYPTLIGAIPLKIDSGTRVSARLQSTSGGGDSILMGVALVGFGSAP